MMRAWTLPLRLLVILALALLVSGAWLFRRDLLRLARSPGQPEEAPAPATGAPSPVTLARARDKVDSMNGWRADSVVLTSAEMASLILAGLPADARRHLDSVAVTLGDGRVTVSALLETSQIPRDELGPLAGALAPWERISATGLVLAPRPGQAEWHIDALTMRGFTLPEQSSQELVARALENGHKGMVPFALPPGVSGIRVRPGGVALFREESP